MNVYRILFDNSVRFFSLIFSFAVLPLLFSFQVFSFDKEENLLDVIAVKEKIENERSIMLNKAHSFSGVDLIYLGGVLDTDKNQIYSQDNLLKYGNIVFPRFIANTRDELIEMVQMFSGESFSEQNYQQFYQTLLVKPLLSLQLKNQRYSKYQGTLGFWDFFRLDCLLKGSSSSFVCQQRLYNFLNNFYVFDDKYQSVDGSISPIFSDQLFMVFQKIQYKKVARDVFCKSMIKFLEYGGVGDIKMSQMMYSCEVEDYKNYLFLKDVSEINAGFQSGVPNGKFYVNKDLDLYKLLSLQQMLYKQMTSSAELEDYVIAYVDLLTNLLTQENQKGIQILHPFVRGFSSWFNKKILIPYLRSDMAKVSSDQKNKLIAELLVIESGESDGLFKGLNISEENSVSLSGDQVQDVVDLEKLFKANIPNQFVMTHLSKVGDVLKVAGEDQVSKVSFNAEVHFDGARFYVSSLTIPTNKGLEEFVNSLLDTDRYSFAKTLTFLKENLEIAQQEQVLKQDLCGLVKEKFGENVQSCDNSLIKIIKGKSESQSGVIYQFKINTGALIGIDISDKLLEGQILQSLDFTKINSDSTFSFIERIYQYQFQRQDSGFGAKEQILVNEAFKKYFKQTPKKVEIVGNVIKVYFTVKDIDFIGQFDVATQRLKPISLDFGGLRKPVIVQKLAFDLNVDSTEQLNAFLLAPVDYLTKLNSRLVEKYFKDGRLIGGVQDSNDKRK